MVIPGTCWSFRVKVYVAYKMANGWVSIFRFWLAAILFHFEWLPWKVNSNMEVPFLVLMTQNSNNKNIVRTWCELWFCFWCPDGSAFRTSAPPSQPATPPGSLLHGPTDVSPVHFICPPRIMHVLTKLNRVTLTSWQHLQLIQITWS